MAEPQQSMGVTILRSLLFLGIRVGSWFMHKIKVKIGFSSRFGVTSNFNHTRKKFITMNNQLNKQQEHRLK